MRDLDFAGMHVETFFIGQLNAIFARNRLLRSARAGRSEMAFFAARAFRVGWLLLSSSAMFQNLPTRASLSWKQHTCCACGCVYRYQMARSGQGSLTAQRR